MATSNSTTGSAIKLTQEALEEIRFLSDAPDVLTIEPRQFCLLAGWCLGTFYQKRSNGTLLVPFRQHGRLIRYELGDVRRYLDSCKIDPEAAR